MNPTGNYPTDKNQTIMTDINGLCGVLGTGRATAQRIAKEAQAEVRIGRRHSYNIPKIQRYIDSISK